MADNNAPPIKKNILNEPKLKLTGPIQEGGKYPPAFVFNVLNNNPRFTVFTAVPDDKKNKGGTIHAPMNGTEATMILQLLEEVADGPEDTHFFDENKSGRPGQQQIISRTYLGKDKEGRVYISVTADNRPKIKFIFKQTDWHYLRKGDGSELTEAEISVRVAKAYAEHMRELMANVMDSEYEEQQYNNNNRGGGGGNWNNNNRGGGNWNNNSGGGNSGGMSDDWPM